MRLLKQTFRRSLSVMLIAACLSCATGPAPQHTSREVRTSIYYDNKGAELLNRGCYAHALRYLQANHQHYSAADDQEGVAHSLNTIADLYFRTGDMTGALSIYDDAIFVFQSLKDNSGAARAMSNKAATLSAMGRLEEAKAVLDQADAMDTEHAQTALRLKTRALLAIKQNDLPQAKTLLARALEASGGSEASIRGSIYFTSGYVALREKQIDPAQADFNQALEIDRASGAYFDTARDLEALGKCAVARQEYRQAVDYFKRAAKIFALLKDRSKADEAAAQLKQSAAQADIDIQATLHWIHQWLDESKGSPLCE
ncbi:MAG: tetratricopeptide repeat protein [Desulfobacteraceae bacterium]|nr:tetratricopeptide repeat protein [Desulfobacteraceae bacterium]